ncbi:adenylate/guanylate cyclase domain-containing protein [Geodermatophilus sp. SYSU D01036]
MTGRHRDPATGSPLRHRREDVAPALAGAGRTTPGTLTHLIAVHGRRPTVAAMVLVALTLPLAGLVFLLRSDFEGLYWSGPALHFSVFLTVGGVAASLSLVAGEAARRRGDARVLLLSLAFLATSGFMALHAIGTQHVLTHDALPGFTVAITIGLLVAAPFAAASALVDARPPTEAWVARHRQALRGAVFGAIVVWGLWSVAEWPPLQQVTAEGGEHLALTVAATIGALLYLLAAVRLWWVNRSHFGLLLFSVVACYGLLAEALVGVALAGERKWHPAWWVWHALIVIAYLLVFTAARREWRDERFRTLYLPTTREHRGEVSVLVGDLAGFTAFTARHDAVEVAAMLRAYYERAAPLISRRFGGEVEKFAGDGVFATFNRAGDQPDHALRAVEAAAALQAEVARIRAAHPDWPGLRIGVDSGPVVFSEMGGSGYLVYPAVGDTVNVAARLQQHAPVGGVLIGTGTRDQLPAAVDLVPVTGLRLKGRDAAVDAYLVQLPLRTSPVPAPRSGGRRGAASARTPH